MAPSIVSLNNIYEMAKKDAIAMNRIHTAAALDTTLRFLSLKKWAPSQVPFAEALIRLLEIEKDALVELGLYELSSNHPTHVNPPQE